MDPVSTQSKQNNSRINLLASHYNLIIEIYSHHLSMGGECSQCMGEDMNILNSPLPLDLSPEERQAFLKKIEQFEGDFEKITIHKDLKKLLDEFDQEDLGDKERKRWVMNQGQIRLFIWATDSKGVKNKSDLLNREVQIVYLKSSLPTQDSQKLKQKEGSSPEKLQKEQIVAYFHGVMKNGYACTKRGIYLHAEGHIYVGELINSKANGMGKFESRQNGYRYQGFWDEDLPHGKGKESFGDFSYHGDFSEGQKQGKGLLKTPQFQYTGNFQRNKFNGEGILETNIDIYQGKFVDGQKEGEGVWESKVKNQKYVGNFKDNEFNGFGTFYFENGCKYTGSFKDNKMNGEGSIMKEKELLHRGVWCKGENYL